MQDFKKNLILINFNSQRGSGEARKKMTSNSGNRIPRMIVKGIPMVRSIEPTNPC